MRKRITSLKILREKLKNGLLDLKSKGILIQADCDYGYFFTEYKYGHKSGLSKPDEIIGTEMLRRCNHILGKFAGKNDQKNWNIIYKLEHVVLNCDVFPKRYTKDYVNQLEKEFEDYCKGGVR